MTEVYVVSKTNCGREDKWECITQIYVQQAKETDKAFETESLEAVWKQGAHKQHFKTLKTDGTQTVRGKYCFETVSGLRKMSGCKQTTPEHADSSTYAPYLQIRCENKWILSEIDTIMLTLENLTKKYL